MTMKFTKKLEAIGLSETRRTKIAVALDSLHTGISLLDKRNLALMVEHMPEVVQAVNLYAAEEDGLATFDVTGDAPDGVTVDSITKIPPGVTTIFVLHGATVEDKFTTSMLTAVNHVTNLGSVTTIKKVGEVWRPAL